MQFAIFGNPSASNAHQTVDHIFTQILSQGDDFSIERTYLNYLLKSGYHIDSSKVLDDTVIQADAIISIGGDGTFLKTVSKTGMLGIPMIGINTGRLGFMADINTSNATEALRCISRGDYTIQSRSLLELNMDIKNGYPRYALNDIAILKHDISSMINIYAEVDNQPLTTYMADGLVISTPTGSTAYSLSIGGPIITPDCDVIALTPVAPHSLTMRSIILNNGQEIRLSVKSRSHNFLISVDGNSFSTSEENQIVIKKAPFQLSVMKPKGYSFYSTLRGKMMWGADQREM